MQPQVDVSGGVGARVHRVVENIYRVTQDCNTRPLSHTQDTLPFFKSFIAAIDAPQSWDRGVGVGVGGCWWCACMCVLGGVSH